MTSTRERYLKRNVFCTTEAKARLFASLPKIQGEAEQYRDKALRPCASPPIIPRVKDTQSISEQPTQCRPDETSHDHYSSEEASATGPEQQFDLLRLLSGRPHACDQVPDDLLQGLTAIGDCLAILAPDVMAGGNDLLAETLRR